MRAVDTPIGKVVVLPEPPPLHHIGVLDVGDVVDVDVDCPTCGGTGTVDHPLVIGPDVAAFCDRCTEGFVSVRHVVTDVLPIVGSLTFDDLAGCVLVTQHRETGERLVVFVRIGVDVTKLDLPYAVPGGVVLVVKPETS